MTSRYRLFGVLASPYVAKLRALLRYRRLAFDYVPASFDWAPDFQLVRPELAHVTPRIVPIVQYPSDGQYHTDSTVIAYDLEKLHPGERGVVPADPGLAFLSHLIDDFGDEWVLKVAFLYRWGNTQDRNYTNRLVMGELLGGGVPQERIVRAAEQFRDRQISRMPLVGATAHNAPVIEESYRRVLAAMTRLRESQAYLFGSRPSLGDFGLFGALFTCRNDPSSHAVMRDLSPGTLDWVYALDEASGVEGDWAGDVHPATLDLLRVIGQFYLPFLDANAKAVEAGEANVALEIDGKPYAQGSFRYQAKCLRWLREEFAALEGDARARTEAVLARAGCLSVLAP